MPKRVKVNNRTKRQKDKLRKRQSRQQQDQSSEFTLQDTSNESIVSCETIDGVVTAPPGNLPGYGLMGFPPKEEKPLARMQASPRVKMHPPAPRLPSPQGSRLFVKNVTKALSTDSPAWVCTPARVPEHYDGFKPSSAGQAQLDTSVLRVSSSVSKDEEKKTVFKTASDRKNSTDLVVNIVSGEQEKNICANVIEKKEKIDLIENDIDDIQELTDSQAKDCKQNIESTYIEENYNISRSVQGSFHQAHPMFGDNAGTQCVANCLAGLAFNQNKSSTVWTTQDINNILATGDELYTFLQRSSSMHNRYLLVEELPQYFECFSRSFEFTTNSTLATIVCLSDDQPSYADFNALPLYEALQISLVDTDGCFVCFGGNTILIGKTNSVFFTFDSHSRTSKGLFSSNGRSTRLLFNSIEELFMQIQTLAKSMGYSNMVECNITGVKCNSKSIERENKKFNCPRDTNNDIHQNSLDHCTTDCHDEVIFLRSTKERYKFCSMSHDTKQELCNKLGLPCSQIRDLRVIETPSRVLGKPCMNKQINGDGNCFFRAISYSLGSSENHHYKVRKAICKHVLENANDFKTFLRSEDVSVESHVSRMMQEGEWATELEILALAHMLCVDIFTFSDGRWIRFSGKSICASFQSKVDGLYLNHRNENHYDVVLDVTESLNGKENNFEQKTDFMPGKQKCSRKASSHKKKINYQQKRDSSRKKYQENVDFRNHKLSKAALKYKTDAQFRNTSKENDRIRYQTDASYRDGKKTRNRALYKQTESRENLLRKAKVKYETVAAHREKIKRKAVHKYKTNDAYRLNCKKKSVQKYKTDEAHKHNVKKISVQKYKNDDIHRQKMRTRSMEKYKTNEHHRDNVKKASRMKYHTNEKFRKKFLSDCSVKYKTDADFRSKLKNNSKQSYHSNPDCKRKKKQNTTQARLMKKIKLENEEEVVNLFKRNTVRGPDFACCCCHRLLFENQVLLCDRSTYTRSENIASVAEGCIKDTFLHQCTSTCSENCTESSLWICFTCHRKILSGDIPPEASANNMQTEPVPEELSCLNSLEQHLISLHIPFMKIMALPKGGQKNIHGPVVCVPSDLKKTTTLPLKADENLLLRVKLKRKLSYKGYYEYQFTNPTHIIRALEYLKQQNKWYENVTINRDTDGFIRDEEKQVETKVEASDEDNEPPQIAIDSCLQPVDVAQEVLDHFFDDVFNIAPAEGNNPVRMLQEPGNEAKTFPWHFPSGRFSFDEPRDKRLTLARYFNNRLMNADNRFAKDTNYIFFSQYMSELNQVIEKTQISIRKSVTQFGKGKNVNADMIRNPEILSKLLKNDEAFRFMQPIRGTPAYWSAIQKDLFAMLRQLGIPTWFCSFSSAEYRWNDAISSLLKQQNDDRDPEVLDWSEKNEILRSNPVTVARMFEHRFRTFQRDVINSPSEPIGKITDFFQRVEFQQRGSPHMHCLFWVESTPRIDVHGKQAVADFIDKYVTCSIPEENDDSELRKIVLDVQQHSKKHSKSCKKNGSECRFNFPRPPSQRTFITEVVEDEKDDESVHTSIMDTNDSKSELTESQAKEVLLRVWNKIQGDSNDFETTEEVFNDLALTQEIYENALNVLSKKLTVVLKRQPNEVWTNQYNPCLLKCWDANMDIQFVLDPFSCIVYIVSYISKSEREMGMLLRQTKLEAQEGNLDAKCTLKKIGSAYLTHREVTAQEAVYRVCNLRMKEASRKVIFIPVGDNPTRMTKPLSQMNKTRHDAEKCEDEDDDEIWMTNIVERYENRPNNKDFNNMCLAEFCSNYRVLAKSQVPKGPNVNVFELQNSKGFVQKRTRTKEAVVRYPRFNAEKTSEKYYQSRLQLFLPYRNQMQLKPEGFEMYKSFYENGFVKLHDKRCVQSVKNIVESNHTRYAKNENAIEEAQEMYELIGEPEDAWANLCPETEVSRNECIIERSSNQNIDDIADTIPDIVNDLTKADTLYQVQQSSASIEDMLNIMQGLNETQQKVFYYVRDWCLRKIVNEFPIPKAFNIFITGGAGTGKSQLIKAINFEASHLFAKTLSSPEALSVLLTAFTGTASFNIGGCTIHSVFSLPKFLSIPYEPLKEQALSEIRVKLADLQILVIDEVSMVYKRLLYYIHERLVQIKKCKDPFGGVCVIAVGDFFQLPPVKQRKDERLYKDSAVYPTDFWQNFLQVELTEVMRQRDDVPFAKALNLLRTRTLEEPLAIETLDIINECIREGPEDVLHVYSTNNEVNEYNLKMLKHKCENLIEISAKDFQKDKTTGKLCLRDKTFQTRNDSLSCSLLFAINARVMLTRNCDVKDGLVNGVMGYISQFVYEDENKTNVTAVAVIFDSQNVGKSSGKRTKNGNQVLIERVQEEIVIRNSTTCVRHQFPLKLSWACTAHKVQGMTVEQVVVNLDKTFAPGQAYVALTRVTSKDGLYIETDNKEKLTRKLYADSDVKLAMNDMQKLIFEIQQNTFLHGRKVIFHNIQSLNKNFNHMKMDKRFLDSDVICLNETWLLPDHNTCHLAIDGFQLHHLARRESYNNENENTTMLKNSKGGGVAMYLKENNNEKQIIHCSVQNIESIAVKFLKENIIVVTVYRPQTLNVSGFLQTLKILIDKIKLESNACIFVGDFNENVQSNGPIQTLMTNNGFTQLVQFFTTEGGTTLDHVYISNSIQAYTERLSTFYSYHDAVGFHFKV